MKGELEFDEAVDLPEPDAARLDAVPLDAVPLDAVVEEMLATDRSLPRLGIIVSSASAGRAAAHQLITVDMANGHEVAHGGFAFALADTAFACAANSVLPGTVTTDASVSYLAPVRVGDRVDATALVSFSDSRRVVVDVTLRVGDLVVALFRGAGRRLAPAPR